MYRSVTTATAASRGWVEAVLMLRLYIGSSAPHFDTSTCSKQAGGSCEACARAWCYMGCWASGRTVGSANITDLVAGGMLVTTPCRTDDACAAAGDGRDPDLKVRFR